MTRLISCSGVLWAKILTTLSVHRWMTTFWGALGETGQSTEWQHCAHLHDFVLRDLRDVYFFFICSVHVWFLTEKDKLMLAEDALQGCSTETALFTTRPFYLILAIVGLSGQFLRSRGAAVATSGFLACCLLGSWVMVGDLPVLIWCGYLQILGGFITWPDTQSSSWENVSKTQDFLVKTDIIRI